MRTKGSAKELEARRMRAVELLREGWGPSEVARRVGVRPCSVSRWRQALEREGAEALKAKPHPGRPAYLSPRDKRRLVKLLLRGARKAGYDNDLWTCPRVAELIRHEFGVEYHPGWVWHILRQLGWSCQKPQLRARERDETAIAKWKSEDWPRIKKELAATS